VTEYRVGTGFDTHALEEGVPLVLGGVRIDFPRGLAGHSDGDVLAHALTDAVLGAAGLEDIGALFPPGDPALAGADSLELLAKAWERVRIHGWTLANADLVAVRATTTDGLGFTGRGEGLAAQAVALLVR
jgi:2-C-methyl-D-erythritol 2,4-cyclodiphosphate synthase